MAQVKEITTIAEMEALFPVLRQMYPNLTESEYQEVLPERVVQGYRMIAVMDESDKVQAVAGYWIGYRFYCKKFLQIDNMVADQNRTIKGCGKLLLDWVKNKAEEEGCQRILLDTFVENFDAHRLFIREGFIARGYHLTLICKRLTC